MKKILIIVLIISFTTVFQSAALRASETALPEATKTSINLDKGTIDKGYTVATFNDSLKLSLVPGILSASTQVDTEIIDENIEMPWQVDKISKIYQFEFTNKEAYDNHKPFYIQLGYDTASNAYKQVFFYDKNFNSWRPLPTKDVPEKKFVRSLIHLPYARIAVFSFPDTLTVGKASWYAHKNGLFAASPDFPQNSRLRVFNQANGKFVDVTVNDFGPDRNIHPDRPLDLDKAAFARIASLSDGVISIKVEPLYIPDVEGSIVDVPNTGISGKVDTNVRSAIVLKESNGEVIYAKNSTSTLPLASLTKIVSVYTFLTMQKDLAKTAKYSSEDAELNYEWCKPWESAKLNVPDGEEMTVKDLVYVSLVGSANNTIETLVRISGVSRPEFVNRMNDIVKGWGASSTHFVEPTGLSPQNVTTAYDYALIAKNALKNKIVADASVTPVYKFTTITKKIAKSIKNTDSIVRNSVHKISGSKTGYLEEALYCLMTKAENEKGESVIVVTFGAADRAASFAQTEKLIEYGLRKLHASSI